MNESDSIDEIVEAQGWSEATLLMLAQRFIEEKLLTAEFVEFMGACADEENKNGE